MHPVMVRIALLASSTVMGCLPAEATAAGGERTEYLGNPSDERVARCGIIVSGGETARFEPFFDGNGDLEGRLDLDVTKKSPSGHNRSHQSSRFWNGRIGTMIISMERPAEVAVELSATDRSGKTLCTMRRSIMIGRVSSKI